MAALKADLAQAKRALSDQQEWVNKIETANRELQQSAGELRQQLARLNDENQQLKTRQAQRISSVDSAEQTRLNAEIDEAARVLAERNTVIANLEG